MKKAEKLWDLIRTMSTSERRYFKLYATRHVIGQKNNYLLLFDLYCDLDEFNPEVIKAGVEAEGLSTRHLASDKNYLYQMILKGLMAYHSEASIGLRVKECLLQVDILYERGLYDQALAILKRAKELAKPYDLYPLLLEISQWERKILMQKKANSLIVESLDEAAGYLAHLDNMQGYLRLYYRMLGLFQRIPLARREEEQQEWEAFMQHPFLQYDYIPLSFQARMHYWRIYAAYYQATAQLEEEGESLARQLELIRSNLNYAQEFPFDYLSTYARWLLMLRGQEDGSLDWALEELNDFPRGLKKGRRYVEKRVERIVRLVQIKRLTVEGCFLKAVSIEPYVEDLLVPHDKSFSQEEKFSYVLLKGYSFLMSQQPSKVVSLVNLAWDYFDPKSFPLKQSLLRLLNLMAHYELGNFTHLEYAIASSKRYLKKQDRLYETEACMLRYLNRAIGLAPGDEGKRKRFFEKWEQALSKILADPFEKGALDYLDVLDWVRSQGSVSVKK